MLDFRVLGQDLSPPTLPDYNSTNILKTNISLSRQKAVVCWSRAARAARLIVLSCGQVISVLLVLITLHYHSSPPRGFCQLQGCVGGPPDYHNVPLINRDDIKTNLKSK